MQALLALEVFAVDIETNQEMSQPEGFFFDWRWFAFPRIG